MRDRMEKPQQPQQSDECDGNDDDEPTEECCSDDDDDSSGSSSWPRSSSSPSPPSRSGATRGTNTATLRPHDDSSHADDDAPSTLSASASITTPVAKRALLAVSALAAAMAVHSVLLAATFELTATAASSTSIPIYNSSTGICADGGGAAAATAVNSMNTVNSMNATTAATSAADLNTTTTMMMPAWQQILLHEQVVLTNLIHAALLAATAVVVRACGSESAAVWLYFQRNCALYWMVVALLCATADLVAAAPGLLLSSALTFGLLSLAALVCTEAQLRQLRQRQPHSVNRVLYAVTQLLPLVAFSNFCLTTYFWFQQPRDCFLGNAASAASAPNAASTQQQLASFVVTYSEQAHACFLLALVQLAATFPRDAASCAGALLVSLWRLAVAAPALAALDWQSPAYSPRDTCGLAYTLLEILLMLPVLAVSSCLLYQCQSSHTLSPSLRSRRSYDKVVILGASSNNNNNDDTEDVEQQLGSGTDSTTFDEDDDNDNCNVYEESDNSEEEEDPNELYQQQTVIVARIECTTLHTIAYSGCTPTTPHNYCSYYTRQQRWGAWVLSVGCRALLAGMTAEACLLLSQHLVGTHAAHDLYKWGMHVAVMYFFIHYMSVDTSTVYRTARPLLLLACPTGTAVAVWQLGLLQQTATSTKGDNDDAWAQATVVLLIWRAASGLVQTLGALLLVHTEPQRANAALMIREQVAPTATPIQTNAHANDERALESARQSAEHALYRVFLPSLAVYTIHSVAQASCSTPMIARALPPPVVSYDQVEQPQWDVGGADECAATHLVLSPHWPGLGLFFHFGLVLFFFAHDGIQRTRPSYRPSLAIAALCAGHVAVMALVDLFVWDGIQTNGWEHLTQADVLQRVVLLLWALASAYLAVCLNRLWKLRIMPAV